MQRFLLALVLTLFCATADATVEVSPITGGTITPLTDAATITWAANQGYAYSLSLGGDHEFLDPSDLTVGADYTLVITQVTPGSHVPTWGQAFKYPSGIKPTLSTLAGARDILKFFSDGSSLILTSVTNDITGSLQAPSDLTTTVNLTDRVTLTWTDNSDNETGFAVEKNEGVSFETVTVVAAGVTTYDDMVSPGSYTYRIKAKRGTASSAASGSVVGTVPVEDLDAPTTFAASAVIAGQFHGTWVDNSSDEDGFRVYSSDEGSQLIQTFPANTTSGDILHVLPAPGLTVHYFIVAYRDNSPFDDLSPPSNTVTVNYP